MKENFGYGLNYKNNSVQEESEMILYTARRLTPELQAQYQWERGITWWVVPLPKHLSFDAQSSKLSQL